MLKKIWFLLLLNLLAMALLVFVVMTMHDAGQFKKIKEHFDASYQRIDGIIGAEDITFDPDNGIAFIAADDRFAFEKGQSTEGKLYTLDVTDKIAKPIPISDQIDFEFHPHGISLFKDTSGTYLFVIDHSNEGHRIYKFNYIDGQVELIKTFEDANFMISPNDVYAVGPESFYFTNDHGSSDPWNRKLEEYLQKESSNVVFYDGANYRIAASQIAYANGINGSKDGRKVFVAATVGKTIYEYDRNPVSSELKLKEKIYVDSGVDNIEIDEMGNLWVACHPKLLTFVGHSKNPSKYSPSQVLKISFPQGKPKIDEIFMDSGSLISGSSVAAVYRNTMIIGSVGDDNILLCEFK